VAQVFLKAHPVGGWSGPNAGTFRLFGLNQSWADGPAGRERRRWTEPVVWLPEDKHAEGACGRLAYLKTEKDGSGVLTIDLNDVYSSIAEGVKTRRYTTYGNIRIAEGFPPSSITGLRSIGVDYSGLSGAPCLLAMVDKITGGKKKVWLWHVPGNPEEMVSIKENTFVYTQGQAAMRGVFAAPAQVSLSAKTEAMKITISGGSKAGEESSMTIKAIRAEGGDQFFMVATIQKGAPPPVSISGTGLDSILTVGQRTVSFDGQKIVFSLNKDGGPGPR
jgi:hypothetical protein